MSACTFTFNWLDTHLEADPAFVVLTLDGLFDEVFCCEHFRFQHRLALYSEMVLYYTLRNIEEEAAVFEYFGLNKLPP